MEMVNRAKGSLRTFRMQRWRDITFDGLEISGSAEVTYAGRRLQYYHYEAGEQCLQRFLFFDKTEQPFECSSY